MQENISFDSQKWAIIFLGRGRHLRAYWFGIRSLQETLVICRITWSMGHSAVFFTPEKSGGCHFCALHVCCRLLLKSSLPQFPLLSPIEKITPSKPLGVTPTPMLSKKASCSQSLTLSSDHHCLVLLSLLLSLLPLGGQGPSFPVTHKSDWKEAF